MIVSMPMSLTDRLVVVLDMAEVPFTESDLSRGIREASLRGPT